MSYIPKQEAIQQWEAPPGLGPWRSLDDEEYARLEKDYDGDITRWYERVDDHAGDQRPKKKAATGAGGDS